MQARFRSQSSGGDEIEACTSGTLKELLAMHMSPRKAAFGGGARGTAARWVDRAATSCGGGLSVRAGAGVTRQLLDYSVGREAAPEAAG